jgi:hypothetical protein
LQRHCISPQSIFFYFSAKSTRVGLPLSLMPSAPSFGATMKTRSAAILPVSSSHCFAACARAPARVARRARQDAVDVYLFHDVRREARVCLPDPNLLPELRNACAKLPCPEVEPDVPAGLDPG